MQNKCELLSHKIIKMTLDANLHNIPVERSISIGNSMQFDIPTQKNGEDAAKCSMKIKTRMYDDFGEFYFEAEIKGVFLVDTRDLPEDGYRELLTEQGFPKLNAVFIKAIHEISKITNQPIPDLPDVRIHDC